MEQQLSQQLNEIIDTLRAEAPPLMFNGRPEGKCCKYCNTYSAVAKEEPTIVHIRDWTNGKVEVKLLYNGKFYCLMCHRFQA